MISITSNSTVPRKAQSTTIGMYIPSSVGLRDNEKAPDAAAEVLLFQGCIRISNVERALKEAEFSYKRPKKGEYFSLRPSAKRESCTMLGALNLKTQSFYWKNAHEGNAESFISFLRQLISNSKGRKSIVIADNVSYHKSAKTKSFLVKSSLDIMYLPPYSPEFNPIEQVWKWIKHLLNGISTVKKRYF